MEKSVTATEAVRDFSGLLNMIRFKGESYIIKRGGKPVAYMGPIREARTTKTLKELKRVLKELPRMGNELDRFEKDLNEVRKAQPSIPEGNPWE